MGNFTTGNQAESPVAGHPDLLIPDKKSKFYHVFEFIRRAYGSDIEKVLKSINSILLLGLSLKFIKNKLLRTILQTAQAGIPATIFGTEFYLKFKNYLKEIKDERSSAYDKKIAALFKILDIKTPIESTPLTKCGLDLSTEIIFWILSKPKLSSLKILNFYEESGQEIEVFNPDEVNTGKIVLILMEHEDIKFIWYVRIRCLSTLPFVEESWAVIEDNHENRDPLFKRIGKEVIRDFISILDCRKNILKFDGISSIKALPRIKVVEKINQFNVNGLLTEIRNVLKLGRRRAYAFVGRQGTGKSSILRKIGQLATNYMVIYISPEDFSSVWNIKERFELIRLLGKCIIMIEDLDGYGFEEKNERATTFLNEIDDVNDDLNAVIIVTINETNKVHKSIIDRPGRFDRVIQINPPSNNKQVHEILSSKFNKLKPIYCPRSRFRIPDLKKLDNGLISECIKNKFTQAEISNAVMEQMFLDSKKIIEANGRTWNSLDKSFFNERLRKAIDVHLETKRAIASADFSLKAIENDMCKDEIGDLEIKRCECPV